MLLVSFMSGKLYGVTEFTFIAGGAYGDGGWVGGKTAGGGPWGDRWSRQEQWFEI